MQRKAGSFFHGRRTAEGCCRDVCARGGARNREQAVTVLLGFAILDAKSKRMLHFLHGLDLLQEILKDEK